MTDRFEQLVQAIAGNDAFRVGALLSEDPTMVSSRDTEGRTPILLALYFRQEELAKLIRERTPAPDLFEAAALGETELVAGLLKETPLGAKAIAPDGFGVLGLAVYFGRVETARLLLQSGANPNTSSANAFKVRPLHSATAHRDPATSLELARMLLESDADPNVAQAGGWTPLHAVAARGREEIASLLVEHGASLTARSEDGRTPLEMAQAKGHTALEALLGG
ncbi:MAG: ankyrin repeat domain-containing protein [Longimicrobiales bacterium]|nr:ankyrin repeat domain-containing protein [Longimicrobiales bacterium]